MVTEVVSQAMDESEDDTSELAQFMTKETVVDAMAGATDDGGGTSRYG